MASDEQDLVVATGRGRVRGTAEGGVAAFRGIPYAASPVGALRFAPPARHPGWSGIREAAHAGPSVPQGPSRLEAVMGPRVQDWDEDGCLTLNVWTPAEALGGAAGLPVLVWFHGGGFSSGSGGWDWYDGARLAALGPVVVVTANYRLGALGYLYLPEIGASNLGSQDQAAVLGWVRENIAGFGGDPDAVTAGGQSAGAHSAFSLAIAPRTRDLVQRVIAQSGPWGLPPQDPAEAAATARDYLDILGITGPDPGPALRELPVERLLAAHRRLAAERARPGSIAPVMYPVLGGPGHPHPWRQAVAAGALDGKDLLLGTVSDEMTAFRALDPAAPAGRLADRAGDRVFQRGVTAIATGRARQGLPAYVYRFTRRPAPDPLGLGATHCSELPFLHGTFDAYPEAPMLGAVSAADHALARAFGGALVAFAATGSPNGPGLAPWRPYRTAADVREFGS